MKGIFAIALCLLAGGAMAQAGQDLPQAGPFVPTVAQATPVPDNVEILVMLHLPAPHLRADGYGNTNYREDAGRTARQRIASAVAQEYKLELLEDWTMPVLNIDCYRMRLPAGKAAATVLEALAHEGRVVWAQVIQDFVAQSGSDSLYRVQPAAGQWQLDEVRKAATGGKEIVAIVDSGVESNPPRLGGPGITGRELRR